MLLSRRFGQGMGGLMSNINLRQMIIIVMDVSLFYMGAIQLYYDYKLLTNIDPIYLPDAHSFVRSKANPPQWSSTLSHVQNPAPLI